MKYERQWNDYKREWHNTGNVEKYMIEIEQVNLKGTKLTNKSY